MIVGLVSTWREGTLPRNAVASLLECCRWVLVCDGPVGELEVAGAETDLGELARAKGVCLWTGDSWRTEHEKRNAMLEWAKRRGWPTPLWGVYLDGDELLIGARYLPDLIDAATALAPAGEDTASIPLLITEANWSVGKVHRVIRLDLLERHVLSMSQFLFRGSSTVVTFPLQATWAPGEPMTPHNRPPFQGEPHIHHRSYYRPTQAERPRLSALEVEDFRRLEAGAGASSSGGMLEREAGGRFGPTELAPDEEHVLRELAGLEGYRPPRARRYR